MAIVHAESTPCTKSELDLFTTPATQVAIQKGMWIDHQPISSLNSSAPIEFKIAGTDDYLDLSKTMLVMKVKITKRNGTDLGSGEKTAPVNNFLQSLFKQVDVFLNGIQVTQSTGTYAYRSYLETLLNFGPAAKSSQLTAGLFYKDTAGQMNSLDPTVAEGGNEGLKKRYSFTKESMLVDLSGPLFCDIFFSDRLLLNQVDVSIKLSPNRSNFCIMSGEAAADYKIVMQSAVLKVRTVKISPVIKLSHTKELQSGNTAKYPIRRVECKAFTIPSSNPSINKSDLFNGNVPKRIVLGLVESETFNGDYKKNPYNFQLYNMTSVSVTIDGEQRPLKPINLKLTSAGGRNFIEAYNTLFTGTGILNHDSGNDISRDDYYQGYGVICLDLTPDACSASDHFNERNKGNLTLEMQFSRGLPSAVNLIVYGEFESLIEIDQGRHVIYDFSS